MSLKDQIEEERKKLGISLSSSSSPSPQSDLSSIIQSERDKYKADDDAVERGQENKQYADLMKAAYKSNPDSFKPTKTETTPRKGRIPALDYINDKASNVSDFLNRAAITATDTIGLGQVKKRLDDGPSYVSDIFKDNASPADTTAEKAADIVGSLYGFTAPAMGAYATGGKLAANTLRKFAPNAPKLVQSLARGAGAGLAYGSAKEGLDAAVGEDDKSATERLMSVGKETALFAAGDGALHLAGVGAKALVSKLQGTKIGDAFTRFSTRNREADTVVDDLLKNTTDSATTKPQVPSMLRPQNAQNTLDYTMNQIKPDVMQRMTPPYENPTELAKYIQTHIGEGISLKEVKKLSYEDMRQLGEEVAKNLKTFDVAVQVAKEKGFDLPKLLDGKLPNLKERVALDAQKRVSGIYPNEKLDIQKPSFKPVETVRNVENNSLNVNALDNTTPIETRVGEQTRPEVLNTSPEPVANPNVNVPDGVQATIFQSPSFRPATSTTKEITRKQVIDGIRKGLGVVVRTKRMGNVDPAIQGYFKVKPEVIRTKQANDIQVIAHEVGHALDKKHKLSDPQFDSELMPLGQRTSGQNYTPDQIRDEGVGEYIREFLTDPQKALQLAPNFSRHIESILPKNVQKALQSSQRDIATWIDQGAALQLRGQINREASDGLIKRGAEFLRNPKEKLTEKFNKFYSDFVEKLHTLELREKAVFGKVGDATESLYKKARLSVNAPKKAELMLKDFKKILEPLDEYGYTTKDIGDYAAALHARELELLNIESGFSADKIQATIAKFDTPEMNTIQQEIVQYSDKLLQMLVKGEVISPQAYAAMKAKYPDYVPFYRYFEEDLTSSISNGGSGFADLVNPIKKLKGSSRDVIDPLESIIKNTFAIVSTVEKNKVGLELSRMAKVDGSGKFIEKLDGKQSVAKENIVTVFEKGEKVQYQLDPDFYKAIKNLDQEGSNTFIKILSKPAEILRAGATLTPEFIIRNPIRDQYSSFVVSEYGYNPLIDLPAGMFNVLFKNSAKHGKYYRQWIEEGGGYGQYVSGDRNLLQEQLRELKNVNSPLNKGMKAIVNPKEWLTILQKISEVTEEATKVGEFRNAIKKGATPAEAAYASRDLMDFSRSGSSVTQANKVISFLNANIQGKDKLARAFLKNKTRTTVRAVTAVTMPTVGAYIMYKTLANDTQKETIDNSPQWLKDTFLLVPIPNTDVVARIPKPFDLAPIFSNAVENILRFADKNDPQAMDEFIKGAAKQQFELPLMMAGIKPLLENMSNYSFFTGSSVIPARDKDLLTEDQYDPVKTSLAARTIGKVTDSSPYKVDNLISGYGAGLGKYATSLIADPIISATSGMKKPPIAEKKLSEQPFVNSFTVPSTGGGKVMDEFYKELEDKNSKAKSAVKNNVPYEGAGEAKYLNKIAGMIGEYRTAYRNVANSYDIDSVEKRKQLDEINNIMNELAREGLKVKTK